MKLISDLKVGDIIFIINKIRWILDFGEIINNENVLIKCQCYFGNEILYLWNYDTSRHETTNYIVFTDENEAIKEFKNGL